MPRVVTATAARSLADPVLERLSARLATVGVIGLGYVGLPLAAATARAGFSTVGFDSDPDKPRILSSGRSYIEAVSSESLACLVASRQFRATDDFAELADCDLVVICVPTPLTPQRAPDLSYVRATARTVARHLQRGQIVVLESTSYPGTTREVVKPILEATGLRSGTDFFLGYSPEREDPGNADFSSTAIPRVVAGDGPEATRMVEAFYGAVVDRLVVVSSLDTAEAVKITENVFRAVNIALVNELKVVFDRMGLDVWEVIEAAKTKPFGYMPFYPGPGLGGHCIPIDPFYLTWRSREFDIPTRFIELAGEINTAMPRYVVDKLEEALDRRLSKSLGRARILVIGLAYKKNISDVRESPSLELIALLADRGAHVDFHDPHVPRIPHTRRHADLHGRQSVAFDASTVAAYHAVLIATDHDCIDYGLLLTHAKLVIDTRNACARAGFQSDRIVKA